MTDKFKELCSQLKNIQDVDKMKRQFKGIAEELFCNHHIDCGGKKFYFAEVEFYFYRNNVKDKIDFNAEWNKVTYPRITQTGELLFHLSGIDICFESYYDENSAEFGGILIRSVVDASENITAGPLTCMNEMLNTCGKTGLSFPRFVDNQDGAPHSCVVRPTSLTGINNEEAQMDNCYFDVTLPREKWSTRIMRYSTKKRKIEPYTRKYNTSKYEEEWNKYNPNDK